MFPYLLFQLHDETAKVISKVLDGYPGNNSTVEQAWDFIQRSVSLPHEWPNDNNNRQLQLLVSF